MTMGTYGQPSAAATGLDVGDLEDVVDAADLKFGLERDMQEALRPNIYQLDPTLRIIDEGKEHHVEAGFIDILAQADDGALVVIELESGEAPESSISTRADAIA
jgi:RecB family endonuclease NucS